MISYLIILNFLCYATEGNEATISTLLPEDYDLTQEPLPEDGSPIIVKVGWTIKGIFDVNFRDMTVLLALYFRLSWREPRLVLPETVKGNNSTFALPLHSSILEKLWIPDLYIHEAMDVSSFRMIQDVDGIRLHGDSFYYSTLVQTRLACPMFFSRYPFDTQTCPITVSSYNYEENKITLEWMHSGGKVLPDVKVPDYDFKIKSSEIIRWIWCHNCSFDPYSVRRAELVFERRYLGHIMVVYVPSALVVSLAWVSFFWPADAVPGRTVLIITSLLTVISMYGAVGQRSPEASYPKALDIWMFICIVHVVLALFQYAVILTIRRKQNEQPVKLKSKNINTISEYMKTKSFDGSKHLPNKDRPKSSPLSPEDESDAASPAPCQTVWSNWCDDPSPFELEEQLVERIGRIGFLILFFFCVLVYCLYYLI